MAEAILGGIGIAVALPPLVEMLEDFKGYWSEADDKIKGLIVLVKASDVGVMRLRANLAGANIYMTDVERQQMEGLIEYCLERIQKLERILESIYHNADIPGWKDIRQKLKSEKDAKKQKKHTQRLSEFEERFKTVWNNHPIEKLEGELHHTNGLLSSMYGYYRDLPGALLHAPIEDFPCRVIGAAQEPSTSPPSKSGPGPTSFGRDTLSPPQATSSIMSRGRSLAEKIASLKPRALVSSLKGRSKDQQLTEAELSKSDAFQSHYPELPSVALRKRWRVPM